MSVEVRATGSDGAFVAIRSEVVVEQVGDVMEVRTHDSASVLVFKGAEPRRIWVSPLVRRASWPHILAACAMVLALDHGNFGAAALVAIWWIGWARS